MLKPKKLEKYTEQELWDLRQQIVLNSLYVSDYKNSLGIEEHSAMAFFDGYLEYICELAEEDGVKDFEKVCKNYDKPENLASWQMCFDDFSWVKYEDVSFISRLMQ